MVVYGAEFGAVGLTEGPRRARVRVQEGRHHFKTNMQNFQTDIRHNYLAIFCEVGTQPAERDAHVLQLEKKANIGPGSMARSQQICTFLIFRLEILQSFGKFRKRSNHAGNVLRLSLEFSQLYASNNSLW